MNSDSAGFVASLEERLLRLTPDTPRRWGSLTPHEMVCHLSDSFLAVLGERPISMQDWSPLRRRFVKWVALRTPLPWPKGIPTMPEVDPKKGGTQPAAFEADRAALLQVMRRFVAPDARYAGHPGFGAMTRDDALRWTFRHVDHHLRQFGL